MALNGSPFVTNHPEDLSVAGPETVNWLTCLQTISKLVKYIQTDNSVLNVLISLMGSCFLTQVATKHIRT